MKKFLIFVVVSVVILFIIGLLYSKTPKGKEKIQDKMAIELCRENAVKHSQGDKGVERIMLGACDNMEQEYINKHGTKP